MRTSTLFIAGTLVLILGAGMLWFAVFYLQNHLSNQAATVDTVPNQVSASEESFLNSQNTLEQQLTSTTWVWERAVLKNNLEITPLQSRAFSLTFAPGGAVQGTTDCNAISSTYTIENSQLVVAPYSMTRKYCEGSQELVFTNLFSEPSTILFTDEGNLTLLLPFDKGLIYFSPLAIRSTN
jgi:heat shock protein HslJ